MNASTIYMRHVDKEGNVALREHRVWDRELFVQTQDDDARKENGSVAVLTEKEFRKGTPREQLRKA